MYQNLTTTTEKLPSSKGGLTPRQQCAATFFSNVTKKVKNVARYMLPIVALV
jgi:hypothetical protein